MMVMTVKAKTKRSIGLAWFMVPIHPKSWAEVICSVENSRELTTLPNICWLESIQYPFARKMIGV